MASFRLDGKPYSKRHRKPPVSASKKKVNTSRNKPVATYFKVVGYDTFAKKYSVAVYINKKYYTTKLMNKEEIKPFNVRTSTTLKNF